MSEVSTIIWNCPKCNAQNEAQSHGDCRSILDWRSVPMWQAVDLSWNPPCTGCGKTQLMEAKGNVSLPIVYLDSEESEWPN